jgi:hypothetical protein
MPVLVSVKLTHRGSIVMYNADDDIIVLMKSFRDDLFTYKTEVRLNLF